MPSPEGEHLRRWRKNKRRACRIRLNARTICAGNGDGVHGMSEWELGNPGYTRELSRNIIPYVRACEGMEYTATRNARGRKAGTTLGKWTCTTGQRSSMSPRSGVEARLPRNWRAGPREAANGCGLSASGVRKYGRQRTRNEEVHRTIWAGARDEPERGEREQVRPCAYVFAGVRRPKSKGMHHLAPPQDAMNKFDGQYSREPGSL
ncbi:hypothetical protein DFH09DRAFT_1186923 [Mycena vulgaris]|nr:hypothetical protein DFH09DRAFT_1186923 [Mycena vulgaris]